MSDHGVPSEFQGRIAVIDTQISASLVESLSGKKFLPGQLLGQGCMRAAFPISFHMVQCAPLLPQRIFQKRSSWRFRLVWIAAPVWKMCALPFPGVLVKTLMRCL